MHPKPPRNGPKKAPRPKRAGCDACKAGLKRDKRPAPALAPPPEPAPAPSGPVNQGLLTYGPHHAARALIGAALVRHAAAITPELMHELKQAAGDDAVDLMYAARAEGQSVRDLGEYAGVDPSTIARRLQRADQVLARHGLTTPK